MTGTKAPLAEAGAAAGDYLPAGAVGLQLQDVQAPAGPADGEKVAAATALPSPVGFAHNLPVQLTSFVGRVVETSQVRALLADSRLVTLTGAGGVGKTRLALQVAAGLLTEFPAGVWQVDLAPLTDPALVPVAVACALGLPDHEGGASTATVSGFIGPRRVLVLLDTCEHMLDACAAVTEELLRACPALVILATSREPLAAVGEATWRVPSLPVASDAIELFTDRAERSRPGFAITQENSSAVAEICRRLDGIPLAIELAAARLRTFSPTDIAAGLHDRFRLLTGGSRTAVRRQQTLRGSVDWSYALLTDPERTLFRRLAAFPGGFDLPAAEAVGAGDGLESGQVLDHLALLVDKSLVNAEESDGTTRFRLPETVRQYAAEKLAESGEAGEVRTRHRDHYIAMASLLDHPAADEARRLIGRMEADIDNLRAAFTWSLELPDGETPLRLASWLLPLWLGRGRMLEGLAWFDAALAGQVGTSQQVASEVRVRALADAAILAGWSAAEPRISQAEEAVALARSLGDVALLARALNGAGCAAMMLPGGGQPQLSEAIALARQSDDPWVLAQALARRAFVSVLSGDLVAGRSAAEEGLALAERIGNDHFARVCTTWLGAAMILQGDLQAAVILCTNLLDQCEAERNLGRKFVALAWFGMAHAFMGQPEAARQAGETSVAIADDLGIFAFGTFGYWCLCLAAMAAGDPNALREASHALWQRTGFTPWAGAWHHANMAEASLGAGDIAAARQHVDQAISELAEGELTYQFTTGLLASAYVAIAEGNAGRAHVEAHRALAIGHRVQSPIGIIDALECLAQGAPGSEDRRKAARLLGAAHALRQQTGYQRFGLRQPAYDATVAGLRAALGEPEFAQAWDEGVSLSCDEAVSYALRGRGGRGRPSTGWPSLTPAERDVARLVGEGLANREIADRLFVSPRTVQTHLTHMYGKLGITSRVQLAQQAVRHSTHG